MKRTFYRRSLPESCIDFSSTEGKQIFREALEAGTMEGYFALAAQFHTQNEPAYCGLGTLSMVLNSLNIDPDRIWKGPWRWFSEDLLSCCKPLEEVRKDGITLGEFACLARCNDAVIEVHRPSQSSVEDFRMQVIQSTKQEKRPLVISYSRKLLGQTGDGHFSPIGGYHPDRDMVLILDVARFKYPPHWVPLTVVFDAMKPHDKSTGQSRGYAILQANTKAKSGILLSNTAEAKTWASLIAKMKATLNNKLCEEKPETKLDFVKIVVEIFKAYILPSYPSMCSCNKDITKEHGSLATKITSQIHTTELYKIVQQVEPSSSKERLDALVLLMFVLPVTRDCVSKNGIKQDIVDIFAFNASLLPDLADEVNYHYGVCEALESTWAIQASLYHPPGQCSIEP